MECVDAGTTAFGHHENEKSGDEASHDKAELCKSNQEILMFQAQCSCSKAL
ncbi:hypothetical protein BN1012_Phect3148 [Candidatus Phaeomarinobacter ectocarpi]|uniref:Uncharacterized protein n=1 Tax=Candidatus Phaeomarinibacter ectocarpi TaxID=1458461 RepID=X5MNK5_9HYPH|nr:hypothetical protein BN1012_Phect3148 [Candidatus Phaeomarinobacter ectocarpi]